MSDTLEQLRSVILPAIVALDSEVSQLYSPASRLGHYEDLARAMDRAFGDPDLTAATFLHGIGPAKAREITAVPATTADILDDWQSLRKMQPPTPPVVSGVYRGDLRALALYVYDSLASLDPDGSLLRWTQSFPLEARQSDVLPPSHRDPEFLQRVRQIVAPIARAWGFWMEGNALFNAVLRLEQPERFAKVMEFVLLQQRLDRGCDQHVRLIKAALKERVDPSRIRWEWHHVASISANLESSKEPDWPRLLHRCGYVTIQCPDEDACYLMLGVLHRGRDHRRQDVRDYIGTSTPARYRALHTLLSTEDDSGSPIFVPVRFVPDGDEVRLALMDGERLTWLRTHRSGPGRSLIRVYTPTGEQKLLAQGATVLNFACEVHQDFLAEGSHAILNGRIKVDLLHPLADGDEVQIVRGEVRSTLPAGWEVRVPKGTFTRIQNAWKKYWRDALAREGHRWLARRLNLPEDELHLVRVLVDMALGDPAPAGGQAGKGATWWLTQIGLHFGSIKAPVDVVVHPVDAERLRDLVAQIEERAGAFAKMAGSPEVMAGGQQMGQVRTWRWCRVCRPVLGNDIVFTVSQRASGTEMVMHRHGETCARGGMPLILRDRVRLDQFFVIETNNQVGVGLQILEVFRDEKVDIVEIVGRRLGTDWGVFRLEVDPVANATIHRIKRRLEALENVNSVRTPLDTGSAILEASLPPRSQSRSPLSRPTPYICGPVAIDDQHFYGREEEMGLLYDLLRQARDQDTSQGLFCFVQGPLRIGKTSLVLRFQLLLRRQPELGVVPVYLKAGLGDTWTTLQRRLEARLNAALREAWRVWDLPPHEMPMGRYDDVIRAVTALPNRPAFVIAIDEAHRLFGACSQSEAERRELVRFRDFVESMRGVLAVWVGTGTGTRELHEDVQQVVLAATPLPIRPFSLDQAIALLEARKLSLFHTITIDRDLARHLYNLTGGEPFLLANLVGIMWSRRQDHASRVVRFDKALVDMARREILSRHEVFAARVDPNAPDRESSLAWRLAIAMAEETTRTGHALDVDALASRVMGNVEPASTRAIERTLTILQERGAVVPCDDGSPRWRVAFPLLTEYLNQPT